MTSEKYKQMDKTKDIYCECCKTYKPVSSFNYRNIRTNIRSANRCKTCDWFYRNHNGIIPIIKGFSQYEIIETVKFILEDEDIYINTLSGKLNRSIEDLIHLIYALNIKNMPIRVKSKCEYCGKDMENNLSTYLIRKDPYCSLECYWKDKTNKIGHGENSQFYNRIETNCTNCGKTIKITPFDYNKTNSFGDNHNFCSQKCYWEYRSKYYIDEKASMHDHEYTEEQKERSRQSLLERLKKDDRLETSIQKKIDIILKENSIEFEREKIFGYYSVDNYLPQCDGIIEVMGDYWHSSPLRYNLDGYLINEMQQKQLHRDKLKYSYITNHYSIPILYLWESDINENPELCKQLINEYISKNKLLDNYHSFNWELSETGIYLKENLIIPYQNISVENYRHLIKKKVG